MSADPVPRFYGILEALGFEQPDWMRDALCREYNRSTFFDQHSTAEAKAICARCSVLDECRAFALADRHLVGVWGGLSGRERSAIRRGVVVSSTEPAPTA